LKFTKTLIEKILERDNLNQAFERVRRNKGAAGVDAKVYRSYSPIFKGKEVSHYYLKSTVSIGVASYKVNDGCQCRQTGKRIYNTFTDL
jgi:hypothetical protein